MKNQKRRTAPRAEVPSLAHTSPTIAAIAERARAIYEASGFLPGHDLDNWLQAERELASPPDRPVVPDASMVAA